MIHTIEALAMAAVAQLPPEVAARFSTRPKVALREGLGMVVSAVDHLDTTRDDGGACDGVSYLDDGIILYRPTQSRRQNFTLAHELGHWLVDQFDEAYDWLAARPEPGKQLETLCDRIAQLLLLPSATTDAVLAGQNPSAMHVVALGEASQASRPVCAIAIAGHLRGLGAVVITNVGQTRIEYASITPDPDLGWPKVYPWPGQAIPVGHPLGRLQPGRTLIQKSSWQMPWGERADFYLNAVHDCGRSVAILSATDLWEAERLHLEEARDFDQRPIQEIRCCGALQQVRGWPCTACSQPHCPKCGKCLCDRRASRETRCTACGLQYQSHLVTNGICVDCN